MNNTANNTTILLFGLSKLNLTLLLYQFRLAYGDERWWKLWAMAVLILDWSLSGLTYLSDYSAYQSILSIVSILTFLVAVNLEVATRLHNYKIKMLEKICRSQLSNCSVMSYLHIISKDCFTDMYKKWLPFAGDFSLENFKDSY